MEEQPLDTCIGVAGHGDEVVRVAPEPIKWPWDCWWSFAWDRPSDGTLYNGEADAQGVDCGGGMPPPKSAGGINPWAPDTVAVATGVTPGKTSAAGGV
jgi:hypothetical protein